MSRIENIAKIRHKLQNQVFSLGSWMQIPHSSIAEILGAAGYDWIAVDMEHGSIGVDQLPNLFRAIELSGNSLPIARLIQGNEVECKRALDAGAGGLILPSINSADQLKKIIQNCAWPPTGTRGVGYSRANLFGKNFEEYKKEAQSPLIVAMIEHKEGVSNLREICSVSGLDAIFVGPYDLSASLGCLGDFESEVYSKTIQFIYETCRSCGMAFGLHVVMPDLQLLKESIDSGAQFIAYSIDAVLMEQSARMPKVCR